MKYVSAFPVLAIVIAAYLLMASGGAMMIDGDAYSMTLMSGAEMTLRGGDFFVIAGLVALTVDLLKLRGAGRPSMLQHGLAIATFLVALNCLAMFDYAATATFFLLVAMALLLVLAGFIAAVLNLRRG